MRLARRWLVYGAIFLVAGVLVAAGLADAQGGSIRIRQVTVRPRSVPGPGGNVTVTAQVQVSGGQAVQSVSAHVLVPGGPSTSLVQSGGVYTGTLRIPFNPGQKNRSVPIEVRATSSGGATAAKRVSVKQAGHKPDPNRPPDPPF